VVGFLRFTSGRTSQFAAEKEKARCRPTPGSKGAVKDFLMFFFCRSLDRSAFTDSPAVHPFTKLKKGRAEADGRLYPGSSIRVFVLQEWGRRVCLRKNRFGYFGWDRIVNGYLLFICFSERRFASGDAILTAETHQFAKLVVTGVRRQPGLLLIKKPRRDEEKEKRIHWEVSNRERSICSPPPRFGAPWHSLGRASAKNTCFICFRRQRQPGGKLLSVVIFFVEHRPARF